MDQRLELSHLSKAEADIAGARERIQRQEALIAHLREHGHDISTAQSLLQTMRDTLILMEEHRALILDELSTMKGRS
jgi:hypothetical protein